MDTQPLSSITTNPTPPSEQPPRRSFLPYYLAGLMLLLIVGGGLWYVAKNGSVSLSFKQTDILTDPAYKADLKVLTAELRSQNLKGAVIEIIKRKSHTQGTAEAWEISASGQSHFLFEIPDVGSTGCGLLGCGVDMDRALDEDDAATQAIGILPDKSFAFDKKSGTNAVSYQLRFGNPPSQFWQKAKVPEVKREGGSVTTYSFIPTMTTGSCGSVSPSGRYFVTMLWDPNKPAEVNFSTMAPSYALGEPIDKHVQQKKTIAQLPILDFCWTPNEDVLVMHEYAQRDSSGEITGKSAVYTYQISSGALAMLVELESPYRVIHVTSPRSFFMARSGETYKVEVDYRGTPQLTKLLPKHIKLAGIID